jgi:hypothetical protein
MQLDGELENDWNGPNAKATEKLMEHAAANMDHPIKKIPADPPFHSRYQYVLGD